MAPKKAAAQPQQQENIQLGPNAREGENVFGVAHIFASFNDTFVVCFMSCGYQYWIPLIVSGRSHKSRESKERT